MPPAPTTTQGRNEQLNDIKSRALTISDQVNKMATTQRSARNGQPPATITASSLAPRPEATLAEPVSPTLAPALLGEIEAQSDQYTANLEKQAAELQPAATSGVQSYIDQLTQSRGITGLTDTAYRTAGGVDDIQVELNDISDQIRKEQMALRRTLERLDKNQEGRIGQGTQFEKARIERQSLSKQADLYIIQMGVQGRYDSAKAIADRAVSAQLEQQTNDLEIAKFNYLENKELFTKAEQRAFEAKAADRERLLTEQKENKTAIYDLAIQAQQDGAPTAVVQAMMTAKTREEAAGLGGQYIGALDREAKRASISASYASQANSLLSQRMNLMELAMAGDAQSITQLGYDPRQTGLTSDEVKQAEAEINQAGVSLNVIDNLLQNERGIGAITGQVKNPTISGFFQGGKAEGIGTLTRFVPGVGNIQGAVQSRNDRDNALTDLTYIYNTEGFQTFIGFKESGLTFGSLTEGERAAIFAAANRLNSAIERNPISGEVTGYRGTDENLRADLALVGDGLEAYQEEKLSTLVLSPTERDEIAKTQ